MKTTLIVIAVLILSALIFLPRLKKVNPVKEIPSPSSSPVFTEYQAFFEIHTLGTKRVFSDSKYHNKSANVFVTKENPGTIYIKDPGISWADFFVTLPMKLEKDCLTTGTGQLFCTNETNSLRFFVDGFEEPNALDQVIKPNSTLKVIYD
ncbi:MAG TPA: hypothetical protein VJ227_01655 [Patescibacteria group bacterium]|nr:hypothetical protein [Patescibacteria group bacterium]